MIYDPEKEAITVYILFICMQLVVILEYLFDMSQKLTVTLSE